jgi:hypothetical protein
MSTSNNTTTPASFRVPHITNVNSSSLDGGRQGSELIIIRLTCMPFMKHTFLMRLSKNSVQNFSSRMNLRTPIPVKNTVEMSKSLKMASALEQSMTMAKHSASTLMME